MSSGDDSARQALGSAPPLGLLTVLAEASNDDELMEHFLTTLETHLDERSGSSVRNRTTGGKKKKKKGGKRKNKDESAEEETTSQSSTGWFGF